MSDRPTQQSTDPGDDRAEEAAELARRIHDSLAGIRSAVQVVRERLPPRSWEHEVLGQTLEALDRTTTLATQAGAAPAHDSAARGDRAFALPAEGVSLDAVERTLVEQALERADGNCTRAGELLGLTRDQVRYRMEKFGLDTASEP